MQNFHNAAYREEEREMVPTLRIFGTGMIPLVSPLPWLSDQAVEAGRGHGARQDGRQLPRAQPAQAGREPAED